MKDPRRHRATGPGGWDEGVARERTVLSWQRTSLATIAIAVLVVRAGIVQHMLPLAIPAGALILVAGAVEWLVSFRIESDNDRPLDAGAMLHDRWIAALGLVTVIAAAASAALALGG
jgi:uncharacterized membrane protein YidH (DUF202 family)